MVARGTRALGARPLDVAVAVLACAGYGTLVVEATSVGRPFPATVLGALFVVVALAGFWGVRMLAGRWSPLLRAVHVLVVLALGFAAFTMEAPTGSILLLLVPVAQSVLLLPLWAAALVTATVPLVHLGMAPGEGLRSGTGTLAAAVFTAVVTELLRRENRSRQELASAHRRLQELAAQAEQLATAQERNRVARDIHDGLGHHLTVVRMQLQAAGALLPTDPRRAEELLGKAQEQTTAALDEVRASVAALRQPRSRGGLDTALEALAEELTPSGLQVAVAVDGQRRELPPEVAEALYRVAEEGLTNVRKHSGAARAEVLLMYGGGEVRLEVRDTGTGLEPVDGTGGGYGLVGLRERIARLDGSVELRSTAGQGTTLTAEVPA